MPTVYTTFINFQIGKVNLTLNPQEHIISLNAVKPAIGVVNVTLTLYDDTAYKVEQLIADNYLKNVGGGFYLQYGFSFFRESTVMGLMLLDYTVAFKSGALELTLELVSTSISSLGTPRIKSFNGKSIHSIIKELAVVEGWEIGYIESTAPVFDPVYKRPMTFNQENETSKKFIENKLIRLSKSASTGQSGYRLYFTEKDGRTYVNYCSDQYIKKPMYNYEFTYYSPENSEVISFTPTFQGAARALAYGETMTGVGYDPVKRQFYQVDFNSKTNTSQVILAPKRDGVIASSERVYDLGDVPVDQAKLLMSNRWYTFAAANTEATIEVMGNPNITSNETMSIIMYDKHGYPHHTSGVYLVMDVTDSVNGGTFTTTCTLRRNGGNMGSLVNVGRRNY